jgi:vacuolar-type H+-ATPase subunit F/Vma7
MQRQHITAPPDSQKNFLVVDSKTDNAAIEEAFERFTTERKDIGILLINQHVRILLLKHKMIRLIRLPDC